MQIIIFSDEIKAF